MDRKRYTNDGIQRQVRACAAAGLAVIAMLCWGIGDAEARSPFLCRTVVNRDNVPSLRITHLRHISCRSATKLLRGYLDNYTRRAPAGFRCSEGGIPRQGACVKGRRCVAFVGPALALTPTQRPTFFPPAPGPMCVVYR